MSAPSDAERAREIAEKVRCTPGTVDIRSRVLMWSHLIESALSAARAEGRAEGRAEEREACARIAENEHSRSPDGRFEMTDHPSYILREVEKSIAAAIRGRKP